MGRETGGTRLIPRVTDPAGMRDKEKVKGRERLRDSARDVAILPGDHNSIKKNY